MSRTEAPGKKSQRRKPLLQEWRNGQEAAMSPLLDKKIKEEMESTGIQDSPAEQERKLLRVDCSNTGKTERKKVKLLSADESNVAEENETVL